MKKLIIFILGILIITLSSCSNSQETYSLYYIEDPVHINDFSIEVNSISSKVISSDVINMEFSILVSNESNKESNYKLENLNLLRNKTNEFFTVEKSFSGNTISIKENSYQIIYFSSIVNKSNQYTNYIFSYNTEKEKMNINLFQKEDENIEVYKVDYIFNGEQRGYSYSKSNTIFSPKGITYDDIYYNDIWYKDKLMKTKICDEYILADTVLYGQSIPILIYKKDVDKLLYVDGINKLPENNRIIIPKEFEGKKISGLSLDGSEARNILSIYIPKGLEKINLINFSDLQKIFFEGSKEEWEKFELTTLSAKVIIQFNSDEYSNLNSNE